MVLDVTHQPLTTSPSHQPSGVTTTTAEDPVVVQFKLMRLTISSFLDAQQNSTPNPQQSFCIYLYSEIVHLEEQDFLTFRNETVKRLCGIQYKANRRMQETGHNNSTDSSYNFPTSRSHTSHDTRYSTSFNTSCSAKPSSSTTTSNSDCKTPTTEVFIIIHHHSRHLFLLWMTSSMDHPEN